MAGADGSGGWGEIEEKGWWRTGVGPSGDALGAVRGRKEEEEVEPPVLPVTPRSNTQYYPATLFRSTIF
jgi:hypothetical protein